MVQLIMLQSIYTLVWQHVLQKYCWKEKKIPSNISMEIIIQMKIIMFILLFSRFEMSWILCEEEKA